MFSIDGTRMAIVFLCFVSLKIWSRTGCSHLCFGRDGRNSISRSTCTQSCSTSANTLVSTYRSLASSMDDEPCTVRHRVLETDGVRIASQFRTAAPQPSRQPPFLTLRRPRVRYPLADLCQTADATFFVRSRRRANGRPRGDRVVSADPETPPPLVPMSPRNSF